MAVAPYLPCSKGSASTACPGRTVSPPTGCHAAVFGAMVSSTWHGIVSGIGPITTVEPGRQVGMDVAQLLPLMVCDDHSPKTMPRAPSLPPTYVRRSQVGLCMCRLPVLAVVVDADIRGAKDS